MPSFFRKQQTDNEIRMKPRFHSPSYRFLETKMHLSAQKIIFSCDSNDESEMN